jgi:hypothetical protein
VSGSAIESAKSADDVADVRVVDVAVNDVSDDAFGVKAFANLVRREANAYKIVRLKKRRTILGGKALAGESAVKNRLNVCGQFHKRSAISLQLL